MMLAPWVEPPAEFRRRDLVLAELIVGFKQDALHRLEGIPEEQLEDDPALLAAACDAIESRVI